MTRGAPLLAAALVALAGAPAAAQIAVSDSPASNASAIGRVVSGTTASVFTVNATTGAVTRVSGTAVRLTSGAATSPTITITCGDSNACQNRDVRVRVAAAAPTGGRASIASFTVAGLTGTTYNSGSAPAEAAALDFQLNPIGRNDSVSFRLGLRVNVPATGNTGLTTLNWTVTVNQL